MATAPDTVVPNSLNYTDIKPQAIENRILLTRYQPTAMVSGAKGGDMVKFLMSGNGFLDPYSTYFQFKVVIEDLLDNEIRWLDRSAHSFFERIVIRSQGVEIERIDNYDIIAAMINDMLYSPEQCSQHYWEAFPTHTFDPQIGSFRADGGDANDRFLDMVNPAAFSVSAVAFPKGYGPNAAQNGEIAAQDGFNTRYSTAIDVREHLLRWLCQGSSPSTMGYVGETAFYRPLTVPQRTNAQIGGFGAAIGNTAARAQAPCDFVFFPDITKYEEIASAVGLPRYDANAGYSNNAVWNPGLFGEDYNPNNLLYPITFGCHQQGVRVPAMWPHLTAGNNNTVFKTVNTTEMQFIVPIYSGVLGLLMPEKRLLPLNLLPLDIEITFNRHALYSSKSNGRRTYTIKEFYIYGNTFFFEQEIHRQLEASVADHGLFLYCNSFHSAPVQLIESKQVPSVIQISMNLKSINSVHWVFFYTHFETKPCARKLHFVSHCITKMQLQNGTPLIPQYAVEGNMGSSGQGQQLQFIVELYKAWNKMHDPSRDGSHHAYNTCGDEYCGQFDAIYDYSVQNSITLQAQPVENINLTTYRSSLLTMLQIANKQANVGRCQYGISLEGEELGSDRTMITGRKSMYPFQIQLFSNLGKVSSHMSYMQTFLRADFIIFIRPDLQIVTLGK